MASTSSPSTSTTGETGGQEFFKFSESPHSSHMGIEYDGEKGRYAVATEDLSAGSTILLEKAFAIAPRLPSSSPLQKNQQDIPHNLCFWCCLPMLNDSQTEKCGKCQAKFCSRDCMEASQGVHSMLECSRLPTLTQLASRSSFLTPTIVLLAARVLVLLALARQQSEPKVESSSFSTTSSSSTSSTSSSSSSSSSLILPHQLFQCFLIEHPSLSSVFSLQSHEELLDSVTLENIRDTARMLLRLLNTRLRQYVSLEQLITLFCILNINVHALEFYRNRPHSPKPEELGVRSAPVEVGIGLFPTLSLLNHSCNPNTQMAFSAGGLVRVRANRAIKRGEPLTISYIDLYLPPLKRQLKLLRSKYFLCTCPRCLEVSETDLNIGAQLCSKCSEGTILPPILTPAAKSAAEKIALAKEVSKSPSRRIELIENSDGLESKCAQCGFVRKWSDIRKSESACRNLLRGALEQPPELRYDSLEALLGRSSSLFSRLHPKHYLITLLTVQQMSSAISRIGTSHQLVSIKHIEQILENVDAVFPPYNLERAAFLEQHGDICHHIAADQNAEKGAFIRLVGQALIFYDRAAEQYRIALGPDHPNTRTAEEKAYGLRAFIHQ